MLERARLETEVAKHY